MFKSKQKVELSKMTYEEFMDALHYGYKAGWISDIKCSTHDGLPATREEEMEWEEGYDPCQPAIRFWGESGKPVDSVEDFIRAELS